MDEELYWKMEELMEEYASGGLDDEGLLAGLDMVAWQAIEVDGCDPSEFVEEMSRAAHNMNVGHSVGKLLGFEE